MASINFTQGKFESFLDSGAVNNGGDVALFTADGTFSTPKTTYTTSALSTPNAHPLVLDSAGRATVFFEGDADVRIRDSLAVTVYTQRNVNPSSVVTSHLFSANTTLDGTHAEAMVEVTGATTLSLTAAVTLGQGWRVNVKNSGTGSVTIARLAGGDKINGTASNITLPAGASVVIAVADAIDGFTTYGVNIGDGLTFTGNNDHTGIELFSSTLGPSYTQNYSLAGTVVGNAMTGTISGYSGTALSATNKAQFTYRSATVATGTTSVVSATANMTLVISSGSTLGATNAVPFRLWWAVVNDAGTLRLAVQNCSTSTQIFAISDDVLITSTAEGGVGGSDSAGVWYTGTAVTAKAARIIGYTEHSLTTAGTWDEVPDKTQLWQAGMKLPGDVVQIARTSTGAVATGATAIPNDDTIPQITEGDEYMTRVITPTAVVNYLSIKANWCGSHSAAGQTLTAALFRDATASALAAVSTSKPTGGYTLELQVYHLVQAGSTAATTFRLRTGSDAGATTTFNGTGGARRYGGVMASFMEVSEIMG